MLNYDSLFSNAFKGLKGNIIRELYKYTTQPGFISFAGGNPSPATFPSEQLAEIASEVLKKNSTVCLQYGVSNGQLPLRQYIAETMTAEGVPTKPENVVVTTGSQQSLDMISKALLNPGDVVLVENPTYVAALKIFSIYGVKVLPIPSDDNGVIPEELAKILATTPVKMIYLIPNFQNPTGITIPWERREKIMKIIKNYQTILLEDDPYGKLRYSGEPVAHMKTIDTEDQIIYMGSFSKIIAPGLRVAYVVCNEQIAAKIVLAKQNNDMHTPNLTQLIVNEYCRKGYLEPHIQDCIALYKRKRDMMLSLMEKYFPKEMEWIVPQGGLFLWSRLPEGRSSMKLLWDYLLPVKVAYVPGESFFVNGEGTNTMRLNFSNADENSMETGLKLLGEQIGNYLSDK